MILLRRAERKGFEVFLTRRPDSMPFLSGMCCYPGGTVRKDDCSAAMIGRCLGLTRERARTIVDAQFSPEQAIGIWVAGVRELFEEVGVLLAVDESGARLAMGSDWSVSSPDPLQAIEVAVTRSAPAVIEPAMHTARWDAFLPEEALTLEAAVRAYTAGSPGSCGGNVRRRGGRLRGRGARLRDARRFDRRFAALGASLRRTRRRPDDVGNLPSRDSGSEPRDA